MKKIFFVLSLFISAFAFGQAGYTNIFNKYHWDGGLFRRLGIPAGDSAQFLSGQAQRQGSVYMDTVNTPDSPNGYYIYEDPTGGNAPFWNLQGNDQICQNRLISDWNVSWQGVGFNYSVHGGLTSGQGTYQIGCSFYTEDSASVLFDPADADDDRIDIIYLDATGVHVREGELAAPGTAVRPTVDADEILLTEVLVAAGATTPTLTQLIVYNENTESVVTNTGTTTNGANATFVYIGALSTNVTNITHNDQVFFTKAPPASTWNVLGFDGISIAIRLKATMPSNGNLGVALQVGTTTSGTEVIIPLVKTNSSSYQQISIPLSAFGNISNTNITRVRFRYIRPASGANYTGFYLDYIYFVDGFSTGPSPQAVFTFNPPVEFIVTPSPTQQSPGTWTMQAASTALAGEYYTREGFIPLPDFVDTVSTLDGRSKVSDGGVVDGNELFLQVVDATFPGLMTSAMFNKLDSNYWIANAGDGDTLAFPDPVSPNITRIKSITTDPPGVITATDTTLHFDLTGVGGGGGRFGVSGEDNTAAESRNFDLGGFGFILSGEGDDDDVIEIRRTDIDVNAATMELMIGATTATLRHIDFGDTTSITVSSSGGGIIFDDWQGRYKFDDLVDDLTATKVMVYNTTSELIGTADISGLGGGGGDALTTDGLDQFAATTSAELAGVISNETGTGALVFGTSPTFTTNIGLAGATSGTVTVASDALANALNVTTLSGTGYSSGTMISRLTSDFTQANVNTEQPVFGTGQDVWTLQGATTYYFEGFYTFTHNAISHSIALSFPLGGGGSVTSISYNVLAWIQGYGTLTATQTTTAINVTTSVVVNSAGSNATESVRFSGFISMNAGGTVTPSMTYSADPTGTILVKTGSYITFTPVGVNTLSTLGNVN